MLMKLNKKNRPIKPEAAASNPNARGAANPRVFDTACSISRSSETEVYRYYTGCAIDPVNPLRSDVLPTPEIDFRRASLGQLQGQVADWIRGFRELRDHYVGEMNSTWFYGLSFAAFRAAGLPYEQWTRQGRYARFNWDFTSLVGPHRRYCKIWEALLGFRDHLTGLRIARQRPGNLERSFIEHLSNAMVAYRKNLRDRFVAAASVIGRFGFEVRLKGQLDAAWARGQHDVARVLEVRMGEEMRKTDDLYRRAFVEGWDLAVCSFEDWGMSIAG